MTNATAPEIVSPGGFAAQLRGFGPAGIVAVLLVVVGIAVSPPIGAIVIVLWVWLSKTPWRDIGYVRPKSWIGAIVIGIALGVALKIAMKSVVMPQLGAPPMNMAFQDMAGNLPAVAEFAIYAIIGAGWGEETVFRGWLFERLGKLIGQGIGAKIVIVVLGAALFGLAHYMGQGWFGVAQAAIVGLVFGTIFAITGRLVMLMFAHAAFDLTAAGMIYAGLETKLAHLVFP